MDLYVFRESKLNRSPDDFSVITRLAHNPPIHRLETQSEAIDNNRVTAFASEFFMDLKLNHTYDLCELRDARKALLPFSKKIVDADQRRTLLRHLSGYI